MEAVETPIGHLPAPGSLDLDGLEISHADLDPLLTVDAQAWKLEADQMPELSGRSASTCPSGCGSCTRTWSTGSPRAEPGPWPNT